MEYEYVIILLDSSSPSFCYYNSAVDNCVRMSSELLKETILYCKNQNLHATVVYPGSGLNTIEQDLLSNFEHIRILPFSLVDDLSDSDIFIIDYNQYIYQFKAIKSGLNINVILRISMSQIRDIELIYKNYKDKFSRLSIILTDIDSADETGLNNYRLDLKKLKEHIYKGTNFDEWFQLSIITDRIMLGSMNNCNAGISHFTIAPNGKLYICPAFYYNHPNRSIGNISTEINVANKHLLQLENSPICSKCDCFHCKRCVFLNKKMTNEVNIPSHQQCVISHHERNTSGILLEKIQNRGLMQDIQNIKPIFYLDPFEIIKN